MTRRVYGAVLALLLGFTLFAAAGEKAQCTMPAGDCASKMYSKLVHSGWLGIETEKTEKGLVTVKAVVPQSPAQAAGFQPGDVLLAINGIELSDANKEAVMKAKKSLVAGSQATYTVRRQGARKELTATLVAPSRALVAQWIGEHMIAEHASAEVASK